MKTKINVLETYRLTACEENKKTLYFDFFTREFSEKITETESFFEAITSFEWAEAGNLRGEALGRKIILILDVSEETGNIDFQRKVFEKRIGCI
jgi:hypothetical protein